MASAFRRKYENISDSLKSKIVISSGDNSTEVVALWDTGATLCCVSERVVADLSLKKTGTARMSTPSSVDEIVDTYLVDLLLPNNILIEDVRVVHSKIGSQGIGLLVGMDIISRGDFLITNSGQTVFSFRMPPEPLPNFVSGVSASNILSGRKNNKNAYRPKSRRR